MNDLRELNGGHDLPGMEQEMRGIIAKFEHASETAGQLESVMSNFSDEQKQLQEAIDAETEWMNKMKERLAKCDDVTGSDDDIIARFMESKVSKDSLTDSWNQRKAMIH